VRAVLLVSLGFLYLWKKFASALFSSSHWYPDLYVNKKSLPNLFYLVLLDLSLAFLVFFVSAASEGIVLEFVVIAPD
jgi:hypothetical protein